MTGSVLNNKELRQLASLGQKIRKNLGCNINGHDIPCRTCRFSAVNAMKKYLKIHNFEVYQK